MRITDKYAAVRRMITDIFEDNHRSYGYRRIQASLSRQRVFLSEKVVQRLMKQERLQAARPKRRTYRSYVGEVSPAPDNIIARDFHADAPNEKWGVRTITWTGLCCDAKVRAISRGLIEPREISIRFSLYRWM